MHHIKVKCIKKLHIELEIVNLLDETQGEKLNIGLDNRFLDMTPKAWIIRAKNLYSSAFQIKNKL